MANKRFIALPSPLSETVTRHLQAHTGWGRGRIVGKFELLAVTNSALADKLIAAGGIVLPAFWNGIDRLPDAIKAELKSAFPTESFVTIGEMLSHVHGHDEWAG